MKKITILLLLIAPLALTISSCRKEGKTVTKTINVQLNANESYSNRIPPGDADDMMQITSQAQHYSVSNVSFDPASGNSMFQYTPALNYTGTDEVDITNAEGDHHGNGHAGGGNCGGGHHHDDQTIYIYKINIGGQDNALGKATK